MNAYLQPSISWCLMTIFLSLPDACCNKTAWNWWSHISIHANKYLLSSSLLYNSSITDIEHSPSYNAFSLLQTHLIWSWQPYTVIYNQDIDLMSWVFTNGLGDWGSIPGWVIPKSQKMVHNASWLNPQHYKVWSNPKTGVVPSPTPRCCTYWKGSLLVTLD